MRLINFFGFVLVMTIVIGLSFFLSSCGQIGLPQGGPKDTIAPKLVRANPTNGSKNVISNKIALTFDEYIDLQNLQQNLIISPLQSRNPNITANPKTINLKFRDSLLPNTTYTINFGDAIRDINEANIFKNFSYVFSTGAYIDSSTISGKVILAETGKIDSTLMILLYRNAVDSTVKKKKPNYISKVNGDGSFSFKNLPAADFKVYALKDGDGGKTYNSESELFAFANEDVSAAKSESITLFAFATAKETDKPNNSLPEKVIKEKKLSYSNNITKTKDILEPLEIYFSTALKSYDTSKIYITDTFYNKINGLKYSLDTSLKKLTIDKKWQVEESLILFVNKDAVLDTLGKELTKNDTIRFATKRKEDYGKLVLRFNDLELNKNPILQFLSGEAIKFSFPLTAKEWSNNLFPPGEYDIRILYDTDKNGKWTPGDYNKKLQPEIAVTLPQKLSVRADWDNEREINL